MYDVSPASGLSGNGLSGNGLSGNGLLMDALNGKAFASTSTLMNSSSGRTNAPYTDPFGTPGPCQYNCTSHGTDGFDKCGNYTHVVTVWRNFDVNTQYKICNKGNTKCLEVASSSRPTRRSGTSRRSSPSLAPTFEGPVGTPTGPFSFLGSGYHRWGLSHPSGATPCCSDVNRAEGV